MASENPFRIEPIPKMRRFAFDAGYHGRHRHIVHGLLEVDVTDARQILGEWENKTGEKLSFTAFVIYCLSRAVEQHPHLHAYRDWRNRLVIFDDIHINSMFEVEMGGKKVPMPHIFRATNRRSFLDINAELRDKQQNPGTAEASSFMRWFLLLPAVVRRMFYWAVMRFPGRFRTYSTSVLVTAVGMFGKGGGWAITMPNFTLTVAVGGISRKPGVVDDQIAIREYLNITASIDHDIVDGAPAARFAQTFRELLEGAYGLKDLAG